MTLTLPDLAGAQVVAFLLVLARVGGLFLLAPIFSARMIPMRAKLVAASAIALALMPLASRGQTVPTDIVDVAALVVKEAVVGIAFAFAIGVLGAAVQVGAGLIDTIVGFSYAAVVDPITNIQNAVFGQVYALFVAITFLAIGGDHMMIMGLARSYDLVPLDGFPSLDGLGSLALAGFGQMFVIGIEIAAPAVLALLVVDAGLAIVTRAVPQANVFVLGLPAKIIVAFAVVAASLPFVGRHLQGELERSVLTALQAFGVG